MQLKQARSNFLDKKHTIEEKRKRLSELERGGASDAHKRHALQAKITRLEAELRDLEKIYTDLQKEYDSLKNEIKSLRELARQHRTTSKELIEKNQLIKNLKIQAPSKSTVDAAKLTLVKSEEALTAAQAKLEKSRAVMESHAAKNRKPPKKDIEKAAHREEAYNKAKKEHEAAKDYHEALVTKSLGISAEINILTLEVGNINALLADIVVRAGNLEQEMSLGWAEGDFDGSDDEDYTSDTEVPSSSPQPSVAQESHSTQGSDDDMPPLEGDEEEDDVLGATGSTESSSGSPSPQPGPSHAQPPPPPQSAKPTGRQRPKFTPPPPPPPKPPKPSEDLQSQLTASLQSRRRRMDSSSSGSGDEGQ